MERLGDPAVWSEHLPPRDVWIFKPGIDEKLPMPVNHRGLVMIDRFVKDVKSTVDPSYEWNLDKLNLHHLYFPQNKYIESDEELSLSDFRKLKSNIVELPEEFHAWAHLVMQEAPIPPDESRIYRRDAEYASKKLLSIGEYSDRMKVLEKYDENELESLQSRQLEHFLFQLEALREFPDGYGYLPPEPLEDTPRTVKDMYRLRERLGHKALSLVNLIRLPEVEPAAA